MCACGGCTAAAAEVEQSGFMKQQRSIVTDPFNVLTRKHETRCVLMILVLLLCYSVLRDCCCCCCTGVLLYSVTKYWRIRIEIVSFLSKNNAGINSLSVKKRHHDQPSIASDLVVRRRLVTTRAFVECVWSFAKQNKKREEKLLQYSSSILYMKKLQSRDHTQLIGTATERHNINYWIFNKPKKKSLAARRHHHPTR